MTREYVKVLPTSGSVTESVPTAEPAARFSATVAALRVIWVGASLTFVIEIEKTLSVESPP